MTRPVPAFSETTVRFFADFRQIDPKHLLPLKILQEVVPLVETYISAYVLRDEKEIAERSKHLGAYLEAHKLEKFGETPFLRLFPSHFVLPRNRIAPLPLQHLRSNL